MSVNNGIEMCNLVASIKIDRDPEFVHLETLIEKIKINYSSISAIMCTNTFQNVRKSLLSSPEVNDEITNFSKHTIVQLYGLNHSHPPP